VRVFPRYVVEPVDGLEETAVDVPTTSRSMALADDLRMWTKELLAGDKILVEGGDVWCRSSRPASIAFGRTCADGPATGEYEAEIAIGFGISDPDVLVIAMASIFWGKTPTGSCSTQVPNHPIGEVEIPRQFCR